MTGYRLLRTVLVGVLLGVALAFAAVGVAQSTDGEPMPLVVALRVAAEAAEVSVVIADVPDATVFMPKVVDDWRETFVHLARVYGLTVCEIGPGTLMVSGSEYAVGACAPEEPVAEEVVEPAMVQVEPEPVAVAAVEAEPVVVPADLVYRVRVLQLDETRAVELGLDWSGGVFETAARLVAGVQAIGNGIFPVAHMGSLVRFLESEGVALRLEDVELRSYGGVPVRFNRGGSISVNLVGGGDASVAETYQYGLGLDLEGSEREGVVELRYQFTDSSPSNVSDPRNVQIASTTSASVVRVPCGHSVVLAAVGSSREGWQGSGVPVASAVPGLGYVFGSGGSVNGRTTFIVTVDVGCSA